MEIDDDDASFLSVAKKRPRQVQVETETSISRMRSSTSNEKVANIVLSIPSSDDDDDVDDDDDIATLRASQSFFDNGDAFINADDVDDVTIEKLHETQDVSHSTPWSPLTASPFTPHGARTNESSFRNDKRVSDTRKNAGTTASFEAVPTDISTTTKSGPRGLNLSKVRPTNSKGGNKSENENGVTVPSKRSESNGTKAEFATIAPPPQKTHRTSAATTTNTKTSVLESTAIMHQSPQERSSTNASTEKRKRLSNPMNEVNVWKEDTRTLLHPEKEGKDGTCTSAPRETGKKKQKKDHQKAGTGSFTASLINNNMEGPVQETKKAVMESTKISINKENVTEPLLNMIKSGSATNDKNDPPIKKKKSSKSIEKAEDIKSTTSSTVTTVAKPKKLTFQEQVMVHMLNAMKPFTLKLLSEEMKTSESSVNFVLLSLVDKGLVVQKDFASSKGRVKTLYWANHNAKAKEVKVCTAEHALASREERDTAHRQMLDVRNEIATIRNRYQQVIQTPSNDDLTHLLTKQEAELQQLYRTRTDVQERIRTAANTVVPRQGGFQSRTNASKTPAALAKERCPIRLKQRINHLRDEWKKRKTKCMDFVEQLADGLEKKPKDVIHLCDIDTDEMNHVVMPVKYPIP